jgi:hypothetical protein
MEEIIKAIEEIFSKRNIRYVIIGGLASSIYGKPRMTSDIDIILMVEDKDNIKEILNKFLNYGFKKISSKKLKGFLNGYPLKIKHKNSFSIDLRLAGFSIDFESIENAKKIKFLGFNIFLPKPEDLIVYKLIRFNDVDKFDIKMIALRNKINWGYVKDKAKKIEDEIKVNIVENLEKIKGELGIGER